MVELQRAYTPFMSRCYCTSLRTAARKVSALYDAALDPIGVNIAQFGMLRKVERAGSVSLTELGLLCDLDRSTIGRNAKVLERMNLVRIGPGRDGREAVLALTERGTLALREGAPLWDSAQGKVEAALGGEAVSRLLSLLGDM